MWQRSYAGGGGGGGGGGCGGGGAAAGAGDGSRTSKKSRRAKRASDVVLEPMRDADPTADPIIDMRGGNPVVVTDIAALVSGSEGTLGK